MKNWDRILLFDGSMGALLGSMGYDAVCPDEMTVTHPDVIQSIHERYLEAGANVVISDSFGSTEMALRHKKKSGMGATFARRAVEIARRAVGGSALVAADIGPTSEFMAPVGAYEFEDFYKTFSEQARAAKDAGADFALIETQTDVAECRAACMACRDAGLDAAASFSIASNGRTLTGSSPEVCALTLQSAGAFAVGLNCSSGPDEMLSPLRRMRAVTPLPVIVQPNAGLPQTAPDGRVFYPFSPEAMLASMRAIVDAGASAIGGCCGTTPDHIRAISVLAGGTLPSSAWDGKEYVCSARSFAPLSDAVSGIAEIEDAEDAYDVDEDATMILLNLNGLSPDEARELARDTAAATRLPLGFRADASALEALEAALRVYPGVAAVSASAEAREIAFRYGARIIA